MVSISGEIHKFWGLKDLQEQWVGWVWSKTPRGCYSWCLLDLQVRLLGWVLTFPYLTQSWTLDTGTNKSNKCRVPMTNNLAEGESIYFTIPSFFYIYMYWLMRIILICKINQMVFASVREEEGMEVRCLATSVVGGQWKLFQRTSLLRLLWSPPLYVNDKGGLQREVKANGPPKVSCSMHADQLCNLLALCNSIMRGGGEKKLEKKEKCPAGDLD